MIPVENSHLNLAADSHEGMSGKNNEDLFFAASFELSETDSTPVLFAMIADGIGGHRAGEVAAKIAVNVVSEAVAESDGKNPVVVMQAAMMQANQSIYEVSQSDESKEGMGTTCICAWIIGNRIYAASVGNSRMYLLRRNRLVQVNVDHTWVQEAVDAGILNKEQARSHPHSNVIHRHLGSENPVEVDLRLRVRPDEDYEKALKNQGTRIYPGDRLILCSDGLNDMVEDKDIHSISAGENLEDVVSALIEKANENGGKDNITAMLLEVPGSPSRIFIDFGDPVVRHNLWAGAALIIVLTFAGFTFRGWQDIKSNPPATPTTTFTATIQASPTLEPTEAPSLTPTETSLPTLTPLPTISRQGIPSATPGAASGDGG